MSASAHRDHVIRVAYQNPVPALCPLPVKPGQIEVSQARRDHPPCRVPASLRLTARSSITPCALHRAQQLQGMTFDDVTGERCVRLNAQLGGNDDGGGIRRRGLGSESVQSEPGVERPPTER